jgi:hypothetical protein
VRLPADEVAARDAAKAREITEFADLLRDYQRRGLLDAREAPEVDDVLDEDALDDDVLDEDALADLRDAVTDAIT